ncbi:amino acid adenylation domain-containing protein [Kineococcus sp. TBRC 1896]|uniref:Phenyloxazoline synthase MbtB n=1 Tax=Kineococcus mangrovi TaxID=1660183 RepID=A0ABV4I064_9ACTN
MTTTDQNPATTDRAGSGDLDLNPDLDLDRARRLVAELHDDGVQLWVEDGGLRFRAPAGVLTDDRRAVVRAQREAVLAVLAAPDDVEITPAPEHRLRPFGLTEMQSAYLLGRGDAYEFGGTACHAYAEIEVDDLDPDALSAAWHRLLERHDALRTVVSPDGYQQTVPLRAALAGTDLPVVAVQDLRGRDEASVRAELARTRAELDHRVAATDRWPLVVLRVTRTDRTAVLHLSVDLLVADQDSVRILLGELRTLHDDPAAELPVLQVGFRDLVLAGQRATTTARYRADREHWLARLDDLPAAPELPLAARGARGRGPVRFSRYAGRLDPQQWRRFGDRAAAAGITPTAAVMAAFAEVVGRFSRTRRFTLDVPVSRRPTGHPQAAAVVGEFTDVDLLAVDLGEELPFADRSRRLAGQLLDDLAHAAFGGTEVLAELARRRGQGAALMPVVFTSALAGPSTGAGWGRETCSITQTPQVWLDCQVRPDVTADGDGVLLAFDVRDGVLAEGVAAAAHESFLELLHALAADGEEAAARWSEPAEVPLPRAQAAVRAAVNATGEPPADRGLLHEDVVRQALADPGAPALAGGGAMTRGELLARSARLVQVLQQNGVERGDRVAVVMDKGPEQVVAVLATSLAGAVYLPVDTNQPQARREAVLTDARVALVLTQPWLDPAGGRPHLAVDLTTPAPDLPQRLPDTGDVAPEQAAYVIYTSGSTGTPKGVVVSHAAATATLSDVVQRFGVGAGDRVLGLAQLGFDLSVFDVFGVLGTGGVLVLPEAARRGDPSHWADLVAEHRVTLWNSVPAQLQMLHDYLGGSEHGTGPDEDLASLRVALLSGDWLPVGLPDAVRRRVPGLRVVSLGGATEAAIWSIVHEVGAVDPTWSSIPYGTPLTGQRWHVLDEGFRPRPDLVPGELFIAGAGLASGYLGDPERTTARFVHHPRTGERLYRTGDLGRYLPDGTLEFLGREDTQVKVRGHRIELAEVETAVQSHPGVAAAAVLAVGDPRGARRLVGFAEPARRAGADAVQRRVSDEAVAAAGAAAADLTRDVDGAALTEFLTALDDLALDAARTALAEVPADEVDPRHHRLVGRWRRALDQHPARPAPGADVLDALERRVGWSTDLVEYVRTCVQRLPELLRGTLDARSLLFPGAQTDVAGSAYRDNLAVRHLNAATAAAVRRIARARSEAGEDPLRVLEIGGGTGGTTSALVPALADLGVDYLFTDVSPFFVGEAREQFADFDFLRYATYDLDVDPAAQGVAAHSVDVVVAANVLHDAADVALALQRVRQVLAPGGWLVLLETTRDLQPALLVSMEFVEGLTQAHDDLRAAEDQTFVTLEQWRALLAAEGAAEHLVLPRAGEPLDAVGQHLLLAQFGLDREPVSTGSLARHTAQQLPDHMVPTAWHLLDALPHTANGKVDRSALAGLLLPDPASSGATSGAAAGTSAPPADDLERDLARLWADLLEQGGVGRDDDFFALGGDSLLVARMVGQLRDRVGAHVPGVADLEWEVVLRHMLRTPTVAGLAEYLRSTVEDAGTSPEGPASPYVVLHGAGTDPVTALVHAGTGTLTPYRALMTEVRRRSGGGSSLVGLELPDVAEFLSADPARIITDWAEGYARSLLDSGARRFHVVGYCLGGLIATEVARSLTDAGAQVESLTAISTHRPPFRLDDELISEYAFAVMMGIDPTEVGFPADEDRVSAASDAVLAATPGLLGDGAVAALEGEFADVAESFRALGAVPRAERIARYCAAVPASGGSYTPEQLESMFAVFRQSVFAISRYEPEPYAGDITFLRHSGSYPFPGNKESVTDYWERLTLGTLDVVDVPGDHFSLLSVPYAPGIARMLDGLTAGDLLR